MPRECIEVSTTVEVLKIGVPALLIAVGWFVVHVLNTKRELQYLQKSTGAEHCDLLIALAGKLDADVRAYHTGERDMAMERRVLAQFTNLGLLISSLRDFGLAPEQFVQVVSNFTDLRAFSTGWHFQDEHTGKVNSESEELGAIDIAMSVFVTSVVLAKTTFVKPLTLN